ncbi:hypothetical protein DXG03_000468 [Asterophora parasitica]|uniref:Ankyrin repeat protein n=1 Tax=Asterophora parasitica TaxID=117018 RepID=A0A9P7KEB0_9AGAR|nr:hypothetical protein DXG03_000468 [Asterophora parasitica]
MQKNIWVAAADGDLDRIKVRARVLIIMRVLMSSQHLVQVECKYFQHAAASYAQLDVLAYLIDHGGDVNITDDDGDTPLYTVENIPTAQFLVDHGATIDRRNSEGLSPIDHLSEDFPDVASFLQSRLSPGPSTSAVNAPASPSQHTQDAAANHLTSALLASVDEIMHRAAAEGRDPDAELRDVVSRTVLEGVVTGFQMTTTEDAREDSPAKRPRTDGPP